MKLLPLALCLLTVTPLVQKQPDRTVPLVFRDRVEIVKLSEAKKEYDQIFKRHCHFGGPGGTDLLCEPMAADEKSRFEALTIAIGTLPNECTERQAFAGLCYRIVGGN